MNKGWMIWLTLIFLSGFHLLAQSPHDILETSEEDPSIYTGELKFPQNWHKKNEKIVALPLKIYSSLNKNTTLPPIFWLSGGPGQTNMDYIPPEELLENHDVVLIGYRGMDGIPKLTCPEIQKALKGIGPDLLSERSVRNMIKSAENCAGRLGLEGIDLNGFTIEQVLMDLDSVRSLLGYEKIHLLSGSYGTRVALMYAQLYGEFLERSVMIGANPPGRFVWQPEIIHEKIRDYAALCKEDPYCRSKTDDLEQTFTEVMKNMPKRWWGFRLDPGKVRMTAFGMLYHRKSALMVIDAFLAAGKGDYSGLALMSLAYNFILPEMMTWGDFISKGMVDYNPHINYFNGFSNSKYPLGSPISTLVMDIGTIWPTRQPRGVFQKLDTIDSETLILNGALDFPPRMKS